MELGEDNMAVAVGNTQMVLFEGKNVLAGLTRTEANNLNENKIRY